jgi:DNA-binding NarL/FixJ family response regulator
MIYPGQVVPIAEECGLIGEFCVYGEAIDGFDAIDKAQNLKPDLIILDASMPRMNGIEAAPKLKKLLPETRIILFTFHEGRSYLAGVWQRGKLIVRGVGGGSRHSAPSSKV